MALEAIFSPSWSTRVEVPTSLSCRSQYPSTFNVSIVRAMNLRPSYDNDDVFVETLLQHFNLIPSSSKALVIAQFDSLASRRLIHGIFSIHCSFRRCE